MSQPVTAKHSIRRYARAELHPNGEPVCLSSAVLALEMERDALQARSLVYLACPYTHESRVVRASRFDMANHAAGWLMRQGLNVFSPISHTHPIAEACGLPLSFEHWQRYDRAFIECSSEMYVLAIYGWRESVGVTAEIAMAREGGIPVRMLTNAHDGVWPPSGFVVADMEVEVAS